jgi:hypothetical protein
MPFIGKLNTPDVAGELVSSSSDAAEYVMRLDADVKVGAVPSVSPLDDVKIPEA